MIIDTRQATTLVREVLRGSDLHPDTQEVIMALVGQQRPSTAMLREAADRVGRGKKIEAIKGVREATGWDLAEAKAWVDELAEAMLRGAS